jgi:ferredoxin
MIVKIDETLCTGCSLCATDLPEVFEMGDDGLAQVKEASPKGEMAEKARETAAMCPASAILVEG